MTEGSCKDKTLSCNHDESDTRLIFVHTRHPLALKQIVVSSSHDTNVAFLCIYHKGGIYSPELSFWTGVKDKYRIIRVHIICANFGSDLGFHALTGSDSTSGFASIGKVKFFELKVHPTKYSSVSKCV